MPRCPVCAAEIGDRAFQLVLPGVPEPFDRLECLERWRGQQATVAEEDAATYTPPVAELPLGPFLRKVALPAATVAVVAALASAAAVLSLREPPRDRGALEATAPSREPVLHQAVAGAYATASVERTPGRPHVRPTEKPGPKRQAAETGVPVAVRTVAPPPAPAPTVVTAPPPAPPPPPSASPPSSPPPPPPPPPPPAVRPPVLPPPPPPVPTAAPTETRPGWGRGDTNHVHTGPPGQAKDKKPKKN